MSDGFNLINDTFKQYDVYIYTCLFIITRIIYLITLSQLLRSVLWWGYMMTSGLKTLYKEEFLDSFYIISWG